MCQNSQATAGASFEYDSPGRRRGMSSVSALFSIVRFLPKVLRQTVLLVVTSSEASSQYTDKITYRYSAILHTHSCKWYIKHARGWA